MLFLGIRIATITANSTRVNPGVDTDTGIQSRRGQKAVGPVVDDDLVFVYFCSFVHESIVLSFSRPACIAHTVAIPLHGFWAIPDPSATSLLYGLTPYNIGT